MAKQKKTRFRLIHLAIVVLIIYVGVVFNNQRILMRDLKNEKAEIENEISVVEDEIESLKYEIELSDSLEFVERVARDELGMVKPREIIYVDINKAQNTLSESLKDDK